MAKLRDDARDSLAEFQSSIFDASDGHQLVDFIRKKKGLCAQPQQIFDDIRTDRQSLQIEIERLDKENNTLQPEELRPLEMVDNEVQSTSAQNQPHTDEPKSPGRLSVKKASLKLKRLTHTIGRRTLLKEFERTLQESRFLPSTCSTPLSVNPTNLPAGPSNTTNEKSRSRACSTTTGKSLNEAKLCCTPITITDSDTPSVSHRNDQNQTLTPNNNTEDVMRDLQKQNDFLLQLANSDKQTSSSRESSPERHDKENSLKSPIRLPVNLNKTSTPCKTKQRRTFTVHRDISSGKLILSPVKASESSIRQTLFLRTPEKNATPVATKKLVVTPKQKQLLLSKFGRNSTMAGSHQSVASVQKASRIPVIISTTTTTEVSKKSSNQEVVNRLQKVVESGDTAKIIEQLQKSASSNAPVIVIPVNQTFNQGPLDKSHNTAPAPVYLNSPGTNEISSTTTTNVLQPTPIVASSSKDNPIDKDDPMPINNLRLEDIITEDDSSSSDDTPLIKNAEETGGPFNSTKGDKSQNIQKRKLSLRAPPPRISSHHVREIIRSQQLSQLSMDDILDLRKRNSRGELRKSLQLTQRDTTMLDKQVELELLRRSIQEKNCEDEILPMEVLPSPPDEFSDRRILSQPHKTLIGVPVVSDGRAVSDDLINEFSSDRISMSQESTKTNRTFQHQRKKNKMSEQLEKYLEASQQVSKSKYLNISKRKLYSKGYSDATTSDDSSPDKSHSYRKQNSTRKISKTHTTQDDSRRVSRNHSKKIPPSPPRSPSPLSSPPRSFHRLNASSASSAATNPIVNKSKDKIEFIPTNDNELFKRPIGRPPKNHATKKKTNKKILLSPPPSTFCASASVDPAAMDNSCALRRSARGNKPLTAYWSCTPKEYIPLYAIDIIRATKKVNPLSKLSIRKTKAVPSSKDHLVANTKTARSGSVEEKKKSKMSKKQLQEHEPSTTSNECLPEQSNNKRSKSKSKKKDTNDSSTKPSECPSEDMGKVRSKSKSRKQITKDSSATSSECPSEDLDNVRFKSKSKKKGTEDSSATSSECPSEDLDKERSKSKSKKKVTEDNSATSSECPSEDLDNVRSKSKSKNKVTEDNSATSSERPSEDLDKERSKSKSKKKITEDSRATSSERPSEDLDKERSKSKSKKKVIEDNSATSSERPSEDLDNVRSKSKSKKKRTGDSAATSSERPSEDLDKERSKSKSKKKVTGDSSACSKSKSTNKVMENSSAMSNECLSEDLVPQLTPMAEDEESGGHHISRISAWREPSTLKGKGSKLKKRQPSRSNESALEDHNEPPNTSNQFTEDIDKPTTSKPKVAKLNSTDSNQTAPSVWSSGDHPSYIQPKRLTTIAEDLDSERSTSVAVRTSSELMPPPSTNFIEDKSNRYMKKKKDAYRTEHDESIADVSSAQVNRLFDQLKSTSMDVRAEQASCSEQISLNCNVMGRSAVESKCKNLKVRVARLKSTEQSMEGNEKVFDSGFSSEDMSSNPKQRGDILFNWLKHIVRNGKSPSCSEKGVARLFQSDGFHHASVDDLVFKQIDGVEYAFYNTKQEFSFGYMRFNPRTEKRRCTAKKFELCFFILCGKVIISVNRNTVDCKNGDLVTVFQGNFYGIKNISNDPALVMVIKK